MWSRFVLNLKKSQFVLKLKHFAENMAEAVLKRPADAIEEAAPAKALKKGKKKKPKQHVVQLGQSEGCKRKIALVVSYNGSGYYGVQINGEFPTIEKDLFSALISAEAITKDHADNPSKMWFQRGSRTDKGVSAVAQTFSLKAVLIPDFVTKVNEYLPEKIRIMGYVRTTNGFDAKNFCCGRTYTYMTPTFAFAPVEKFITDEFRVEGTTIDRVREVLKRFLGTHNFHNFTSGVKPNQQSAKRYITGFECSDPYVRDGIEFVTITVKGQSFMLHQIRKMIGLTIAVVRGYCGEDTIDMCWLPDKVDVPKAPGLGLVLEELHFDGYNKKFGCDGIHERLDWAPFREEMAKFKEKFILSEIVAQEKADRSMFNWMRTLQFHNFSSEPRPHGPEKPWQYALKTSLAKDKVPSPPASTDCEPLGNPQTENSEKVQPEKVEEMPEKFLRNSEPGEKNSASNASDMTEHLKQNLSEPDAVVNSASVKNNDTCNTENSVAGEEKSDVSIPEQKLPDDSSSPLSQRNAV